MSGARTPDPGRPSGRRPLLPALSLLGQPAPGRPAAGPGGATALMSHTVPGGAAARGPCGESVAALARGLGRGGAGFVGSALRSRPEPLLARGLRTATLHSLPSAHAGRQAPAGGKDREQLTAGDSLLQGTGLEDDRGEGWGVCKRSRGKGPGSQVEPHTAQARGLTLDLVGTR